MSDYVCFCVECDAEFIGTKYAVRCERCIMQLLAEMVDVVESAIRMGDWAVDGRCDPDGALRRARAAIAAAAQRAETRSRLGAKPGRAARSASPTTDRNPNNAQQTN